MASKEQIAEMDNAQRVKALNKAIKKQVNKYFDGSNLKAEVEIRVSKCKECEDDGRIPAHIKDALNRMMGKSKNMGKLGDVLLDELEKAATDHPALKQDPKKDAQVKRMFAIRKELNALVDEEEKLVKQLNDKGCDALTPEERKATHEKVNACDIAQRALLEELQAL